MSKGIVFAMGALLVIGGAMSIATGYNIIEVERGWTEVIAGASALSAGVVTTAIGFLIGAVEKIAPAPAESRSAKPPAPPSESVSRPVEVKPRVPASQNVGALPPVEAPGAWLDETPIETSVAPLEQRLRPTAVQEPAPPERKIVGEYDIAGVQYALYDDGMIEGLTRDGPLRFTSMTELRAYIDGEARRSLLDAKRP